MNRSAIAIGLSLTAAAAAGAIVIVATERNKAPEPAMADPAVWFDPSAGTDERIRALEVAVAEERNARQLLEEELQYLYAEIESLSASDESDDARDEERFAQSRDDAERIEERRQERQVSADERRIAQLIDAGIPPDRAEWLVKRESELRMEAMQARFDARTTGMPLDPTVFNTGASLRAEIGDAEYEQYLQAGGRSTMVEVTTILESSPAQRAGLQRGDQIVAYNGTRVFDIGELNRYTMQGEPGDSVVVDIVRDGVPMQVVLPRGPIGIEIRRGPRRR